LIRKVPTKSRLRGALGAQYAIEEPVEARARIKAWID
jgi:hypothetical protein